MMRMDILCALVAIFAFSIVSPLPIDLFNTDSQKLVIPRPNAGPGLCKENINNDNITNLKWFRYHNETHKCYHIDERGPCGKLMLFYGIGDTEYGDCDCILYYRCARPIIYWAPEKRCYYTNSYPGPCKGSQEWLILDENTHQPTCELNPCRSNQTEVPSTYDRYWFEKDGQCYQTLTQGYCTNPNELLYPKWDEHKPSCNIGRICNARNVRSSTTQIPTNCVPGQKRDKDGSCRPVVRFTYWFRSVFFKR